MERNSGIIMHISSLPNKYGIGTLGKSAYEFADFLKLAGQTYWQILPLGPTGYGDSPYQSFSAFAGNPYLIDLDILKKDGLLNENDYNKVNFGENPNEVDYEKIFNNKMKVLRIAYRNKTVDLDNEINDFEKKNKKWIEDYALYMAIKSYFKLKSWRCWDDDIKRRDIVAIEKYKRLLKNEISYWVFIQYEFFKQWSNLKTYVNSLGIKIIGDVPIYVAEDSSDVWTNPKLFLLDDNMNPIKVAGCPPDAFSDTGQLWGNPIYNWKYIENTDFQWWIDRIRKNLELYDVIRIDHFRGFESYWEIPYDDTTAVNGRWVKGPGERLFNAIKNELGEIDIIAEDLGFLTKEVLEFRENLGFPGMRVLQFAFDSNSKNNYLPHNYITNCIAYTGTHDNDTFLGWFSENQYKDEVKQCIEYLSLNKNEGYNWGFIRGVWSSIAKTSIALMQDFLNLGSQSRINYPSTLGCNWKWRANKSMFNNDLAKKIYKITKLYGRCD